MLFIQGIGIIGLFFLGYSYTRKKKETILLNQIISYIFYSIHYLLLNAKSGYIISVINLVRSLFLTVKDRHKWLQNNIILFFFIVLYIIVTALTYQDIFSLLPCIGTIIFTSMEWQGSVKEMRIGAILNSSLWCIYDVHVSSYVGLASDSLFVIINIVMLIRMCKNDKINKGKVKTITN